VHVAFSPPPSALLRSLTHTRHQVHLHPQQPSRAQSAGPAHYSLLAWTRAGDCLIPGFSRPPALVLSSLLESGLLG
jgi:hypothetical protein